MVRGLVPSNYVVEIDGDKVKRRVYEDWTRFVKGTSVPHVVVLQSGPVDVDAKALQPLVDDTIARYEQMLVDLYGAD